MQLAAWELGIGGLIAINRTFDESVLRAGLKNHTLDSVMFPRDPIRNAPQIISNINRVFPPSRGSHLFGPMLQIAWGTPPLITANLAVVFAQLGARTLLLDADLRKPRQHAIFGVPPGSGLSTLLAGRMDHGSTYPVPGLSRLSLLPAGPLPPNPQELISRPAFTALLKDLQSLYDVVIIDTPPAEAYADAQSVAYRAGDAMVIARKDRTKVSATSKVVRELAGAGARVVGTVINTF
jgi:capsular exopolysaccharide synthesis family protein